MPQDKDFFRRLAAAGYTARRGQEAFWRIVEEMIKGIYLAVLPTGYGKTEAALGAYFIERDRGRVNRMLIIVPSDTQRTQYAEGLTRAAGSLGQDLRQFRDEKSGELRGIRLIEGIASDLRLSHENRCEIFVTTVQAALRPGFFKDLMAKGRWLTFYDEYHKLNAEETAKWGAAANELRGEVVVGMTATPGRSDGSPTIFNGVDVDVVVTFEEAYREEAVRGVVSHIEHYFVDVTTPDGREERITTENLRGASSWDDVERKKELRYTAGYLASMLTSAAACLSAKNLRHPNQHQMLVFAMSQRHAEHVAGVLNSLNANGNGKFADWIGIDRSAAENGRVLDDYKSNILPCLVQVDKASEGFDNKRASVLVFLNILRKNTVKAIQSAGRGVRRNHRIRQFRDDVCDMFASPDTEMADLIVEFSRLTVGPISPDQLPGEGGDVRDGGGGANSPIYPIPPFESLVTGAEYDKSVVYDVTHEEARSYQDLIAKREGFTPTEEQVISAVQKIMAMQAAQRAADEAGPPPITKSRVEDAMRVLASNVLRRLHGSGQNGKMLGDCKHNIHARWISMGGKSATDSLSDDLRAKYDWIAGLNAEFSRSGNVPAWLTRAR